MRFPRVLMICLAVLPVWPGSQGAVQAASLRNMTTLHGPLVYLRDLFDDAGSDGDRILGPGPAPGDRIIVEAPQLNAIARQYNIAWRSVSMADRAILEWPGRPLKREDVLEAVKTAVTAAGASDDIDIDIPGFGAPVVPAEAEAHVAISQLDFDRDTGRFTASLSVTADNMNAINTRISGRVEEMAEVPVASTRLLAETVLREEDVRQARVRASQLGSDVVRSPDEITGMQLRRPVAAGQPLRTADLMRPALVQRGALVRLQLQQGELSVSGLGTALDAGAKGDQIRVQNSSSHSFIYAEVIGPDAVRILLDPRPDLAKGLGRYSRRFQPQ